MTKKQHAALGVALIGIGVSVACWLPLPEGPGIVPTLLGYGISIGEFLAFVGAATTMAAFPEKRP